jgi:hypothetical protein
MRAILLIFLSFIPILAHAAIFGADDRIALTPLSEAYPLARSTAIALIGANISEAAPGKLRLHVDPHPLCPEERFSTDTSLAYSCTGFLVAPDLIATAGHCMVNTGESRHETDTFCQAYSWLFGYDASADPAAIPEENLYRCKQVIYAVRDERAPFRDFALVQLNRPVAGRAPLRLAKGPVGAQETLSMIGHPFGSPAKLSRNARVLLHDPSRQGFIASLDAFEGNSGSPVFNHAREVVGILVGGTPSISLVTDKAQGCERYNQCAEDGSGCTQPDSDTSLFPGFQRTGSEVQHIAPIAELIKGL